MSAMHAVAAPEALSPALYLLSVTVRCPALARILDLLREEPLREEIEAVLADAVRHLPHFPDFGPEKLLVADDEDRGEVVNLELGWLSRQIPWLRSRFESAVFRHLSGKDRAQERAAARFSLALVARLFRLEDAAVYAA